MSLSNSTNAASLAAPIQLSLAPAVTGATARDQFNNSQPTSQDRFAIKDELTLSRAAENAVASSSNADSPGTSSPKAARSAEKGSRAGAKEEPVEGELSEEEEEQVEELKDRDREVRTHEQAHVSAGGSYVTGGPSYEYQKGPDGKNYAIGGEVQIDTAPVDGDPEATIQKARIVRSAALAPAEPSAQDRAVAAQATQTEMQAQAELQEKNREETDGVEEPDSDQNTADSATSASAREPATNNQSNAATSKLLQLITQNAVDAKPFSLNVLV